MTLLYLFVATVSVLMSFTPAFSSPKVTQAALIEFKSRLVEVFALEEFDKPPMLMLRTDRITERTQDDSQTIEFTEVPPPRLINYAINPFLRFRTLRVKGMQDPLIVAMAVQPTATDEWAEVKLIAEKDGKFVVLNPGRLIISIQDGIYIGYVNKRYGSGMITWNFVWDAAHWEPHKYKISIYGWTPNGPGLVLRKTFTTKKRFRDGCNALRYHGLPCRNIRDQVFSIEDDRSTLWAEAELLGTEISDEDDE